MSAEERWPTSTGGGWIGFGNVGLGVSGPPPTTFIRPDLCAGLDHPPKTYNSWMDQTWCMCGARIRPGDALEGVVITDRGLSQWWPDLYLPLMRNPQPRPEGWVREGGSWCAVSDRPRPVQLDLFGEAA